MNHAPARFEAVSAEELAAIEGGFWVAAAATLAIGSVVALGAAVTYAYLES